MYSVEAIADWFITRGHRVREPITPMKLQKLIYFAQAWHLGLFGAALVDARFDVRAFGPNIQVLDDLFGKRFGMEPITSTLDYKTNFEESTVMFLERIWSEYGYFTQEALAADVIRDGVWRKAKSDLKAYIDNKDLMVQYSREGRE